MLRVSISVAFFLAFACGSSTVGIPICESGSRDLTAFRFVSQNSHVDEIFQMTDDFVIIRR